MPWAQNPLGVYVNLPIKKEFPRQVTRIKPLHIKEGIHQVYLNPTNADYKDKTSTYHWEQLI